MKLHSVLTSTHVTRERLLSTKRLRLLFDLRNTADTGLLEDGTHGTCRGFAVVERRRDRRVVIHCVVVELLVVLHPNLMVLEVLDVIEDRVDDVIDLREGSRAAAFCQQRFGNRWQFVISEELHLFDLFVRDGMQELSGVHFGAEEQRPAQVPRSSDAGQQIIANSRAYLAERVGIERRDDKNVGPLHQLQVQALLVEALRDLPLALVGKYLGHRRDFINVYKMLGSFGQHDSYLKKFQFRAKNR